MAGTLQLPYPSAEMWRKRIADQGPEDYMLVAEVKGEVVGKGDLAAQTTQILSNIETALAAAGAGLDHVIQWDVLVVEGQPI